jgi:uncharacterized protein
MSLEELDHWIERLDPPALVDGVSMLDGYLTAIIIGRCSIDPHEWLRHMLGPNGGLGLEGTKPAAAGDRGALQCDQRGIGHGTAALCTHL